MNNFLMQKLFFLNFHVLGFYDKGVLSDIKMAQQGRKKISHLETCFENHMFIQPSFFVLKWFA